MSEITPIAPSHAVIKPVKVQRDDNLPKRQQPKKQQDFEEQHALSMEHEQDTQPTQHIDEIV